MLIDRGGRELGIGGKMHRLNLSLSITILVSVILCNAVSLTEWFIAQAKSGTLTEQKILNFQRQGINAEVVINNAFLEAVKYKQYRTVRLLLMHGVIIQELQQQAFEVAIKNFDEKMVQLFFEWATNPVNRCVFDKIELGKILAAAYGNLVSSYAAKSYSFFNDEDAHVGCLCCCRCGKHTYDFMKRKSMLDRFRDEINSYRAVSLPEITVTIVEAQPVMSSTLSRPASHASSDSGTGFIVTISDDELSGPSGRSEDQ